MSRAAKTWLQRQTIEDRTLREILAVLASEADGAGHCEITQAKLAASVGVAERSIRRLLPILEHLGVLTRAHQSGFARRGRAADLVSLSLDRDFTLPKESIMDAKALGPTGQNVLLNDGDQPDKMSSGPTDENTTAPYKERARSVVLQSSPSNSPSSCSVHVRFDALRSKWRASIKVDKVTMELGRFDTEAEAVEFADNAKADVVRTWPAKAGTPSDPVIAPHLKSLDAPNIGAFLFGDDDEATNDDGSGEADAPGRGTKFLAGFGVEPHDPLHPDAARAGEEAA
ncbi:hypothetical protein ACLE20_15085 [Rhizobium sp. YIM 134829]|uniref:hypothetical protein n=1 Tax=Rhizobium sp. YIM 134829 TaxID=3390453 RepID=UPI00397C54C2